MLTAIATILIPIRRASHLPITMLWVILWLSGPSAAIKRYQNGFPSGAEFFPIGVWLQSPSNASEFQAIGINTFVGLWEGPTEAQLATLKRFGMFVVTDQNETALVSSNRDIIKFPKQDKGLAPALRVHQFVSVADQCAMHTNP